MEDAGGQLECFVIAPIGEVGSDVRNRSDVIFEKVIVPGVLGFGYLPVRADHISEPGIIANQVIEKVVGAPLVVADLYGANPNVFYELALRHALRKPVVLIADVAQKIPFDIAGARVVIVEGTKRRDLEKAAIEVARSVEDLTSGYDIVDSPVSVALGLRSARECALLGVQSGVENDPFSPPRVWAHPVRTNAYAKAASVIKNTPLNPNGRQSLLFAALHGHTSKRLAALPDSTFGPFDEAMFERICDPEWEVLELVNIASRARLDRVIGRLEKFSDADGYEVRAFCMPGALPHLSPLVVGNHHLFLGLEDARFNRVAEMIHIESGAAVDLASKYFRSLWEDRRSYVLRSGVEAQEDAIDEIRRTLRDNESH